MKTKYWEEFKEDDGRKTLSGEHFDLHVKRNGEISFWNNSDTVYGLPKDEVIASLSEAIKWLKENGND